jgi:predicted transposase/invertase (TIGR01784 family)
MKQFLLKLLLGRGKGKLAEIDARDFEPLSIMEDGVFKAMLTQKDEDSREALRSLISACLHREVYSVQVRNNELAPNYLKAKSVRLDVNVTFNDGESVDLEMQTSKTDDDLKKRAEYCTGLLVSSQDAKGGFYRKIKRVYQIFFLDCELFPGSEKFRRRYFYQEEDEHDRLSEMSEILFYELPKLDKWFRDFREGKTSTENLTSEQKWCIYMKYRHIRQARKLIENLCEKEEGIMKAEKTVYKVSRSEKRFARMISEKIGKMDRESELMCAREKAMEEGHAAGHAEGKKEKTLEIAKNLKELGVSPENIQIATGLSMDIINKL